MQTDTPYQKTLVLIGGGHSHVAVLRSFGMLPIPSLRLILISRDICSPYSGMLPGYLAGIYNYDDCHIELRSLAQFANAAFIHAEVNYIDIEHKQIFCHHRPPLYFDILSINIGSKPYTTRIPGAAELAFTVKPIDQFLGKWEQLIQKLKTAQKELKIGIVGAGAGGVEISLCVQHRINIMQLDKHNTLNQYEIHLLTDGENILPTHNQKVREIFERILTERKIKVHTRHQVIEVKNNILCCDNEKQLPMDVVIWVTHASAPKWLEESGLATDEFGFVCVNDYLQSTSHPHIFAVGDIASSINHPRPKSGVFAVKQGPYLTTNLRRIFHGQALLKYIPQQKFLSLISTGNKYAVASRGKLAIEGRWVWNIKNFIDRRFMRKYNKLPKMPARETKENNRDTNTSDQIDEIAKHTMRCRGCGAKVGSAILYRVIQRLQQISYSNITFGITQPDDAAIIDLPPGKTVVQTVDYLRAIVDDDYLFGKITTNHALGDIFAMGASAHSALAIATLPYAEDKIVEEQLYQILSGALEVLNEAGCNLLGGHTSEGAELSFGLAVTGVVDPDKLLRKQTVQPGQAIILTKAIGTGTLFAAEMQGKCKGRWIESAIESMLLSNYAATNIFIKYNATACTDLTGFGLVGHLLEMVNGSESVNMTLYLDALPVLDGAVETISHGIISTLHNKNIPSEPIIGNIKKTTHPNYPLIFDPQTAGGLIGCVPEIDAQACVKELKMHNYVDASIIGYVREKTNNDYLICLEESNYVNSTDKEI